MKMTRMECSEHIAYWCNQQETRTGEHMKTLQYLITLLFFCFLCGCNAPSRNYTLGQMVISPQFDEATNFSEGLARVKIGDEKRGTWGFIDKEGKMIIKPRFFEAKEFHDGLAWVKEKANDTWSLINTQEDMIYINNDNISIDKVADFSEGLAAIGTTFSMSFLEVTAPCEWGFIDKKGRMVIEPQFESVKPFSEGLAAVMIGSKWGYINKNGNIVINPKFLVAEDFHNGAAVVYIPGIEIQRAVVKKVFNDYKVFKDYKVQQEISLGGFIDFSKVAYNMKLSEDRSAFRYGTSSQWGLTDGKGHRVVGPTFDEVHVFSESVVYESLAAVKIGDRWGYIGKQGKMVINPQFDNALDFFNGLACVEMNGKWGFIDIQGNMFINPIFDNIYSFSEGLAAVKIAEKWGFIDVQGKMVINPIFDEVRPFYDGFARIKIAGKWGFISRGPYRKDAGK